MAYDEERDANLVALDAKHLFPDSVTYVGIRRDAYLRKFAYDFIQLLAPHFDRKAVTDALK
jgi:LysR family cys regulon transcriptional activator